MFLGMRMHTSRSPAKSLGPAQAATPTSFSFLPAQGLSPSILNPNSVTSQHDNCHPRDTHCKPGALLGPFCLFQSSSAIAL